MPELTTPAVRTWTDKDGLQHDASLVYTDTLGHGWYAFDSPLQMPAPRAVAAELASEWALMNMTIDDLRAYIRKLKEDGNKGLVVDMFATLRYMEERIEWACEGRSLLELAKCYFIIDDEPLAMQTERHDQLKDEVWKSDPAARSFFLHKSFVLTRGYSGFSESDIPAYLKAQEYIHLKNIEQRSPKQETSDATNGRQKFFTKRGKTSTPKSP